MKLVDKKFLEEKMTEKLCKLLLAGLVVTLSGCGALMKDVMRECDRGQNFDSYAYCIKSTYNQKGNQPNSPNVRAFYANLDMISESFRANKITDAQAKSMAYDSFMRTIQASNDRADAQFLNQMQQQQMQQQMQQQRAPVQTNCVRNGQYTNCTTY